MAKKKKTQDPYEMEMLDLLNEVGGTMTIEYHTAKLTLTKEKLQTLRDAGYETDTYHAMQTIHQCSIHHNGLEVHLGTRR